MKKNLKKIKFYRFSKIARAIFKIPYTILLILIKIGTTKFKIGDLTLICFCIMINTWKEGELMYKFVEENVEIYIICYKKEEMKLIETYYDPVLNVHNWYFNAYLAYKHWKNNFKKLKMGNIARQLLIVSASKYLMYLLDNELYKNQKEYLRILKDMKIIEPELKMIMAEADFIDIN